MISCCSWRRCLLSDLPAEVLQAVTSHLPFQDYSSLRQVSRSVSKRITQFCVPYITLRLSDGSSTQQVQQWCQTMQGLAAVSNIHVNVAVEVSADVFELAMQLLSQRATPVKELHLLSSHGCGSIPSLQPLQHLLPHLQTLVIQGIQFDNLAIDLKQLAAAAVAGPSPGWQLQSLNLSYARYCHWTEFTSAVEHLAKAFPNLQQLVIKLPTVGFWLKSAADPEALLAVYQQLVPCLIGPADVEMYAVTHQHLSEAEIVEAAATGAVAAVIALANAVSQLKALQMLTVTEAPDLWRPRYRRAGTGSPTAPVAVAATMMHATFQQTDKTESLSANSGISSSSSSQECVMSLFSHQLTHYSSRPAADLMRRVISCQLKISCDQVNSLEELLHDLRFLKDFEVYVFSACDILSSPSGSQAAATTIAAAATVPKLQSLKLTFASAVTPPDDLLLPLTAAAGGPGSSLKKLELVGQFVAEDEDNSKWLHVLKQLDGLLELYMYQVPSHLDPDIPPLRVPVYSLPDSLEVLKCMCIRLCTSNESDRTVGTGIRALDSSAASACPRLQHWDQSSFRVDDPSILASGQLQYLRAAFQWSGPWTAAAAAAAWPNVRELVCSICRRHDDGNSGSSSRDNSTGQSDLSTGQPYSVRVMQEIAANFRHLDSLTISRLPGLSVEVLQPLQLLKLKHIELYIAGCGSSVEESINDKAVQEWLQQHQPWASVNIRSM